MVIPRISVIVTIFNVEQYIEKCARCLLEQSMQDIEYVFVNDASTDRSMERLDNIINEYPFRLSWIKIINHDNNKGVACARNTGLMNVTGKFVTYVDSDDWIDKDMYENMYSLGISTNADIVGCNFVKEYGDYSESICQCYVDDNKECIRKLLLGKLFPSLWSQIVKRDLYVHNNLSFAEKVDVGEDLAMNVQLYSYASKIKYSPIAFYHYRKTNPNSYCNVRGLKAINSDIKVAEMVSVFLRKKFGDLFCKEIKYREFVSKLALWRDRQNRDYSRWLKTYPESNRYLWKYECLDWKIKFECWFAIKGFPKLADLFVSLLHFQRRVRDKFIHNK